MNKYRKFIIIFLVLLPIFTQFLKCIEFNNQFINDNYFVLGIFSKYLLLPLLILYIYFILFFKLNKSLVISVFGAGLFLVIINALKYLLDASADFTPIGIIGLVFVAIGLNWVRKK